LILVVPASEYWLEQVLVPLQIPPKTRIRQKSQFDCGAFCVLVEYVTLPLFREKGWNEPAACSQHGWSFPAAPDKGGRIHLGVLKMDSQKPERMLSVKEFAAVVGWGEDTIRRLIYRKLIRAVVLPQINTRKNVHRRARIPESEVERFIRRHANL
jgi:hypothetical protein